MDISHKLMTVMYCFCLFCITGLFSGDHSRLGSVPCWSP